MDAWTTNVPIPFTTEDGHATRESHGEEEQRFAKRGQRPQQEDKEGVLQAVQSEWAQLLNGGEVC